LKSHELVKRWGIVNSPSGEVVAMQNSESILRQRLHTLQEMQASAMDLLFSGTLSKEELNDILEMIPQLQLEAVQVEAALNRVRPLRAAN
jgi:succinyl-CoA synthetase beta subunit